MSAIGSFFHFLTVEIYQRKKSSGAQNSLRLKREVKTMSKKSKPELENMKFEVAREYGVNLTKGYNGNLSSVENGRVGGQMVRKMIEDYQRQHGMQ